MLQGRAIPGQPSLSSDNPGTHTLPTRRDMCDPQQQPPSRAGDTAVSAGPVSGPAATTHPSTGSGWTRGRDRWSQTKTVPSWGRCRQGCAHLPRPGQGTVPVGESPGLLWCGTGAESGTPRPHLPWPHGAGQGGGRGGRAHQRALWSLMKAVLSLWASLSSPSDSEGPSSCQMSEGSPL